MHLDQIVKTGRTIANEKSVATRKKAAKNRQKKNCFEYVRCNITATTEIGFLAKKLETLREIGPEEIALFYL